jgi:hypothetical protein
MHYIVDVNKKKGEKRENGYMQCGERQKVKWE